ncbi:MAG: prepilin-type N-terminal cleavage/methylation domain-containing protein [Candidatus Riflebacteria bacterium]|nr:prepilin-type N-terminal cleavage/methylation domain-containing protein [Candidatus Riflebacteria bacterium]
MHPKSDPKPATARKAETLGFSLLELLFTIFLVSVIATAGYPRLMEYAQQTRTEQEARAIFEDLNLVRQAAISSGMGLTSFNLIKLPTETFVSSYELKAPDNSDIRTIFMDQAIGPPVNSYRRDLKQRKVCIPLPNNIPASTTAMLTVHFDKNGIVTNDPTNAPELRFRVCPLLDDGVNPPQPLTGTSYESWEIAIERPSDASPGRLILRRVP